MSESVTTNEVKTEIDVLKDENAALKSRLSQAVMFREQLSFQQYIDGPPIPDGNKEHLYARACSSDHITANTWLKQWLDQIRANKEHFGDFWNKNVMEEFGKFAYKPCIIAGSGPSLKKNAHLLSDRSIRGDIPVVSCLHNFGYLEDLGVEVDYYLNLDAGEITIGEMYQGGKNAPEWYWDRTKDRTLVTAFTAQPELLKKWKGKILWFACVTGTPEFVGGLKQITDFNVAFSVGGNTLGACLYMAKAILGCSPIVYIGADFCFSYDNHFHSWESPYDQKVTGTMRAVDVFGMPVKTWNSYFNFKCFFDYLACGGQGNQPGDYINCTEGGILGAYQEGNIRQIRQSTLGEILWYYNLHRKLPEILKDKNNYPILF